MADTKSKDLQVKEKQEVAAGAEQTRTGPIFTPAIDIFETDGAIIVLADMPGVKSKDLDIDLKESVLTLSGEVEAPQGADDTAIMTEYQTGTYWRQFTLSRVIDQAKIEAALTDGVLRLTLPKADEAVPRKITVKTG
jgi:HSP20 family molecular chaperone IbpA